MPPEGGSRLTEVLMAIVTLRYWAAAKEAAGIAEETITAGTLAEALAAARGRAGQGLGSERRQPLEQSRQLSWPITRPGAVHDPGHRGSQGSLPRITRGMEVAAVEHRLAA